MTNQEVIRWPEVCVGGPQPFGRPSSKQSTKFKHIRKRKRKQSNRALLCGQIMANLSFSLIGRDDSLSLETSNRRLSSPRLPTQAPTGWRTSNAPNSNNENSQQSTTFCLDNRQLFASSPSSLLTIALVLGLIIHQLPVGLAFGSTRPGELHGLDAHTGAKLISIDYPARPAQRFEELKSSVQIGFNTGESLSPRVQVLD